MPFSKLGLTPSLCTPLVKMGYTQPTPVQSASIPIILTGADRWPVRKRERARPPRSRCR